MERETPSTSNVVRARTRVDGAGPHVAPTRGEARAPQRSAPLTPTQFKTLRRMAEQGISPLRHI